MDSLKNISQFNTGSTVANGMELSESAIISYQTAIDGLSLSQAQAALSSTALTDAQKEQILVSAGLLQSTQAITLEEVKQMASSASLSAQKKEEILTTLQGAYSENEWNMERLEAIAASGGEAGAIAQSILAKKTENAENIKGVASNKALTASLWEQLKARLALLAANPVAWIAGVAAVSVGLIALQKKFTKSLDECTEELSNFNSEVENAQSEADSLQTEWETCQKRLGELQKLADNGTISIIEQEEYERLLKTNDELERNIRIQKEKSQLSAIDAANSADETLSKTVESKYKTSWQDYTGMGVATEQASWITPEEELNAAIEEYNRLQTAIDSLSQSYNNGSILEEEYNTQLTNLTNQQTDARNRASEMSDILEKCEQAYVNLDNTGAELTTTQTANYNSVKQANQKYNDFLGTINGINTAFEDLDTSEKAQTIKNKYAQKTLSLPNGQGTYTVEDKEISDWIDTLPDEDLTVLASINFSGEQTKDSMQEALDYAKNNVNGNINETDILSFSDAWEQLKNSTEDATKGLADDLTKLAEAGQLTAEALTKADTSEFFKNAGISAEEAVKKINELVSASTQLQSMSAQISKMSDMLADKKNGTVASASDLSGFDATVQGLESWEEFEKVMMSSESTMEQCQKAANALATEWVNNGNFLANLTDETKQAYITQLDKMGVDNAEAIVEAVLTQKHNEEALALQYSTAATAYNSSEKGRNNQITTDLINVTGAEITQLLNEGKVSVDTANDLAAYVVQKKIASGTTLNTAADIKNLVDLAGASTKLGKLLNNLAKIKQGFTNGMPSDAAAAQAESLQKQIEALVGGGSNKAVVDVPVEIKPTGSSGYTAPKTGGSGSDTKQTIDWIERLLDVLQKKIDQTKAKFENLFTLKDKKNNLTKQIQLTKNLLTATEKSADRYLKAANKVGLSKSLKKKVKNGSYDINDYSSETAEKIQKYENYYDKYKELKQQADELETDIRSLRIDRQQLYVDQAEAKIAKSQAYAELDSGNYKEQNKHLEAQKKYTKEQYKALIQIAKLKGDTLEVDSLRAEKQKELNDLTKQEFDNIANTYDNKIGLNNNKIQAFQDQISLLEARGQQVGSALYTKQMSLNNVNEEKLIAERAKLIQKLAEIPKGTDNWYAAQDKLFSVESELVNIQIENANLQKSINQLKFDRFDDLLAKLNDIVDETDFLIDMLDSENFFDDNGKITDDGITAMGMYAQKRDIYKAEAEKYKQMQAELDQMYANGDIGIIDYESKMREYKSGEMEMAKAAEDMNKSIINLVSDGLEKQNQALSESIQKQKDLFRAEKDLKSFQDSLNDANKNVSRLERQYEVLSGDDSEENRKRLREIKSQLEDAKKSRDDLLYDKSIEDQEKNLDNMYDAAVKNSEEYLKDSAKVLIDSFNLVNANTETVSKNIERISKETGVDISENITDAWNPSGHAVSGFGTTVSSTMPGVLAQISLVTEQMRKLAEQSEKAAKSLVKDTVDDYTDYTSIGADNNGSSSSPSSQSNIKTGTTSVLGAASPVTGNIIGGVLTGMQMANKTAIASFISNNKKDPVQGTKYASLNQYLLKKYGGVLSKSDEAKLADMLGVEISSRALTGEQGRKDLDKILAALKNIGFSTGGVIDPHDILKRTGEKGYIIANPHEAVLTEPQWESIRDLGTALTNLNQQIYKPYIPEFQTRDAQSPVYNIDSSITVDGVATNEIVKDMANVAKKQAENVITEINRRTYAKGVRWK